MPVTEAQKRATAKYEKENYDKVLVRFPKGTKEKIQSTGAESINGYIIKCVLDTLENAQNAETEPKTRRPEENTPELPKAENKSNSEPKEFREITAEDNAEFMKLIAEKKAKQREQEELVKQAQEQRAAEKRAEEQAEVNKILDRILSGSELEEDAEKEAVRQETIARANCPF